MNRNENIATNGFGFCISNYHEYLTFKRVIIINMENCTLYNLTDREIAAIIFHELGHLLNFPDLHIEPSMLNCMLNGINYDKTLHEEIKTTNSIMEETYADSYAMTHGFGNELISTFVIQNNNFEQQIGFYNERISSLQMNEILKGTIRPIDTNGW